MLCVLYFFNNGFECCGVVDRELGEDLTVDLDACFVDKTHKF